MKPQLITLILFLSVFLSSKAEADTYTFASLDNSDGLSNNQVDCIFKDSRGFMWFGTNYGLNRFDGYNFKVFYTKENDKHSLISNRIQGIQEDIHGNLWINDAELYAIYDYKTETFSHNTSILLQNMKLKPNPKFIEIDKDKNFFAYYQDDGIYKYDVQSRKVFFFQQSDIKGNISLGEINAIKTQDSLFWLLFENGLIERYNQATNSIDLRNEALIRDNNSFYPKQLFIDQEGLPWVYPSFEGKGISYLDTQSLEWISPIGFDKNIFFDAIKDVSQDKTGKIWIASDHGGMFIYDKNTRSATNLKHSLSDPNSIKQNSTVSFFYDDNEIMWIGTQKNGISYYHPNMFKFDKNPLTFFNTNDAEIKDCTSFYEDTKGNLWIGTDGGGLLKYDAKKETFQVFKNEFGNPQSISSDIIISILEDRKGTLWFGTFLGGLNSYDGKHFTNINPKRESPFILSERCIFDMQQDKKGNLWLATLGGGINKYNIANNTLSIYNTKNNQEMTSNYIISMFSKDSVIAYLSTEWGIDILNMETHQIKSFSKTEKTSVFKSNVKSDITASIIDNKGHLWVASYNGILIYNFETKKLREINEANGLPSKQVMSIIEDDQGDIWAGTSNGLVHILKDNVYDNKVIQLNSFFENDGLPSLIFNRNAAYKSPSGKIFMGCAKGYISFFPSDIKSNTIVPKPQFTQLCIQNQEIEPAQKYKNRRIIDQSIVESSEITLAYDHKTFTIFFSALNYISAKKNKYKYKLKGFDEDWILSSNGVGSATYSNLKPGTYQLSVYASNNDGLWNEEPIRLTIIVRPPFWFSWWAYLIYTALFTLGIWYLLHFNLRKQERKFEQTQKLIEAKQLHEMDEMKFLFFTNISHEFRTPLSLIINPIEKLLAEEKIKENKFLLQMVHKNAKALLQLVNQLLDFRKLDVHKASLNSTNGDVVPFLQEICCSFSDLANQKSISLSFCSAMASLNMDFDSDKLKKITNNLLSNAFKFTHQGGTIDVNISLVKFISEDKKILKLSIADTGIGISKENQEKIFDRFFRVKTPETANFTGTGVGLHLAAEFVKLHHGKIELNSILGQGSTFTVLIPATCSSIESYIERPKEIVAASEENLIEAISIENRLEVKPLFPLLLLVDDNEDFRNFMSTLFKDTFNIITAADGEIAHDMILKQIPDLIISDVMMPKIDGLELCRMIKRDLRISHIPIILLTAKTSDENKFSGIEAGADDYISKPFNYDFLILKVSRIMEKQKQKQEKLKKTINISPQEIDIESLDQKFIKKAIAIVEINLINASFGVEELGFEMGLSRVHFYKKILALTAKTPSEFIRILRIKRAAELLLKSQLYVNEVAIMVGFNDVKYFRKYFKDEYGISPSEFKKSQSKC
ncbi:hybrid sensor histidine kinase/response regulator [Bacteroidales bacterium]|nr:hybrid sensor histidine kinase/response regulator [Bacteroidales bacterium]